MPYPDVGVAAAGTQRGFVLIRRGTVPLHCAAAMCVVAGDDAAEWLAILSDPENHLHLYGKHEARPGRKMGHVTILDENRTTLIHKAHKIRQMLRVKAG